MGKLIFMNTGALHKNLFDTPKPDLPRLTAIYDTMDALAIEAAKLRRESELSILREAQAIVQRGADLKKPSRGREAVNDFFTRFSI